MQGRDLFLEKKSFETRNMDRTISVEVRSHASWRSLQVRNKECEQTRQPFLNKGFI